MHTIINTLQDNAPIYRLPVLFVGIHLAAQVHLQVGPKFEHAMVHEMIDLEGVGTTPRWSSHSCSINISNISRFILSGATNGTYHVQQKTSCLFDFLRFRNGALFYHM
jgi:hypothetical protein